MIIANDRSQLVLLTPHFNGFKFTSVLLQKTNTTLINIVNSLLADTSEWAQATLAKLRKNSPLMLAVSLAQIQKAREMTLAEDLRMERDMVFHCFDQTPARHSDTVEGIRAMVIDKDHRPHWQHASIEDVMQVEVDAFFSRRTSPTTN